MFTAIQVVEGLEKIWGELTDAKFDCLVDCLSTNYTFPMSSDMVKEKFGKATLEQLENQMIEYIVQHLNIVRHTIWMNEFSCFDVKLARNKLNILREQFPCEKFRILKCEPMEE